MLLSACSLFSNCHISLGLSPLFHIFLSMEVCDLGGKGVSVDQIWVTGEHDQWPEHEL